MLRIHPPTIQFHAIGLTTHGVIGRPSYGFSISNEIG